MISLLPSVQVFCQLDSLCNDPDLPCEVYPTGYQGKKGIPRDELLKGPKLLSIQPGFKVVSFQFAVSGVCN